MARYKIRNECTAVIGGREHQFSAGIIRDLPDSVGDQLVSAGNADLAPVAKRAAPAKKAARKPAAKRARKR